MVNFLLLAGGEGLSKVCAFLAFAYLARLLGPNVYGDVEFALAVALFFGLAVEGGLGLLGTREIAKSKDPLLSLAFHIVIIRCVLAVVVFSLLFIFVFFMDKPLHIKQLTVFYGLTLFMTPFLLHWIFQGLNQMHWVAISSVVRWSCFAAGIFLFVYERGHAWRIPLIELAAVGCAAALNMSLFKYFFGRFRIRFDLSFTKSLLRQAVPIGVTQIIWGLKVYLPVALLGLLVGSSEVACFAPAQRIVLALNTFILVYYSNLYPSISRCADQEFKVLKRLVSKSLDLTVWSGIFLGAVTMLFAHPLVDFVYGSEYETSVNVLRLLIWFSVISLMAGHYNYVLIALNKQKLELFSTACGALLNIALCALLIPTYGSMGAVLALLTSEAVTYGLAYYFVQRDIGAISLFTRLVKPFVAGAAMVALIVLARPANILLAAIEAFFFYLIFLFCMEPRVLTGIRRFIGRSG